jgi:phage tail tape-measure protein
MSRALFGIVAAGMIMAAPNVASATEEGAVAGAVTGAVAGAAVGGPVGALIGAVVGGVAIGSATEPAANAASPEDPGEPSSARHLQVVPDPQTTGTVVETRTCVRDASGVSRCRREVPR